MSNTRFSTSEELHGAIRLLGPTPRSCLTGPRLSISAGICPAYARSTPRQTYSPEAIVPRLPWTAISEATLIGDNDTSGANWVKVVTIPELC